jgi:3-oxoadipate enol-lactonase
MRTRSHPGLFVTGRGRGEPVLLITGWTISSAVFDPVASLYLPHVRIVAYDHRGAGRSAPWLGPVSMAMLAADAARVLDDRGLRSAHVVGLSMGAAVALELAIRMAHRVTSLVLLGAGAGGPTTITPSLRDAVR